MDPKAAKLLMSEKVGLRAFNPRSPPILNLNRPDGYVDMASTAAPYTTIVFFIIVNYDKDDVPLCRFCLV